MADPKAVRMMDVARIGPHVTCPASRHAAMMAEAMIKGEPYQMMTEDRGHCGESIAHSVTGLWEARATVHALAQALGAIEHGGFTLDRSRRIAREALAKIAKETRG